MKLEIIDPTKADTFSQCFQHMKTFTDSINIVFNEDHMFIQCMDQAMTLIMEFKLPKEWFDVYEVSQSITIGVMTNILTKVLNIRDKTQTIKMNTHEKSDHLSVHYHVDNSPTIFDKSFEIPLISLDSELFHIPDTEYCAEFSLPTISMSSMINQLKSFGDTMTIECTEEHINMVSESQEYGKMNTFIPIEDLEEYSINEGESIKNSFGLKLIGNVCLFQKVAKTMEIGISDNFPMKMNYIMDNDVVLQFYLAPRVD